MTNPFEVKLNTKKYAGTLYLEKDFYDDLANLGWDYTAGRTPRGVCRAAVCSFMIRS